jgi:hypothetical protein
VKRDEVEFELEFAPDGGDPDPRNYHVHVRCFAAWEFERPGFETAATTISASDQARSAAPPIAGEASEHT